MLPKVWVHYLAEQGQLLLDHRDVRLLLHEQFSLAHDRLARALGVILRVAQCQFHINEVIIQLSGVNLIRIVGNQGGNHLPDSLYIGLSQVHPVFLQTEVFHLSPLAAYVDARAVQSGHVGM